MELSHKLQQLEDEKLITKKLNQDGTLAIFKYSKRVFFDNLWDRDELLKDARGLVLSVLDGKIVQYPLTKVYNYGEQGAGLNYNKDLRVEAAVKYNGFMAAVCIHNDQLLITTTGSFDSPYVELAKEMLEYSGGLDISKYSKRYTYVFEICHPFDPHIVKERYGAYLIAIRSNAKLGSLLLSQDNLFNVWRSNFRNTKVRPPVSFSTTLGEALEMAKRTRKEGFIIRHMGGTICKIKSKYYLGLKFLARAKYFLKEDFNPEELKKTVEEEFYPVIDWIWKEYTVEAFKVLSSQEKLDLIRNRL